ncbi:T complex protein 11 protein 1 [Paragonimus heterotremus]|uniref:T complex protein 11 protein 1 n=1 Tax=Paragonimus heterotremus TaxID=100268 RepID=A0A8J4TG42_9TREM|nr:T complex protein 11 protein 1 [Paragonimus heterotremus]
MDSDEETSHPMDDSKTFTDDDSATLTSPRGGRTIKKMQDNINSMFQMPPSPPTFVTMRQLTDAANAFYNMSLAHEITVDSEFRIEKCESLEDSLECTVKETMKRAFWDLLRSSLEADPPDYQPALRLLVEIKQSLNGLVLPNQKTLQKLVDSSLDLDAAREQLSQTGHLSLENYAIQVINLMRQFCAPVRDQEVENLRKIDDPVEAFRNAFIVLEEMHMDLANFTITQMRPFIRQQAVNYERSKFADFLKAQEVIGIDGLRRTREWIREAYLRLAASSEAAPSFTSMSPKSGCDSNSEEAIPLTPNNILREAYLTLLTWPTDKEWPETVVMDQQRLVELGNQLTNIVTLTSLVLVVCTYIASNASELLADLPELVKTGPNMMLEVKRLLCQTGVYVFCTFAIDSLEKKASLLVDEIKYTLERWLTEIAPTASQPENDSPLHRNSKTALFLLPSHMSTILESQIREVVYGRHPVYQLMQKRALTFLRSALSSNPSESVPLPPGFGVLVDAARPSQIDKFDKSAACRADPSAPCSSTQPIPTNLPTMATGVRSVKSPPAEDNNVCKTESPRLYCKPEHLSLTNLASRMLPLLTHNRNVFGPRYAEIIQSILLPRSGEPIRPLQGTNLDRELSSCESDADNNQNNHGSCNDDGKSNNMVT